MATILSDLELRPEGFIEQLPVVNATCDVRLLSKQLHREDPLLAVVVAGAFSHWLLAAVLLLLLVLLVLLLSALTLVVVVVLVLVLVLILVGVGVGGDDDYLCAVAAAVVVITHTSGRNRV
jgi:hypothetical protein